MAARTIETKAIISAEDKTGNAFAAVVQKLARMESAAKTTRIGLGSVDRAATRASRAELAHQREVVRTQREIEHHGFRRYVAQTAATAVAAHSVVEVVAESYKAGAAYQHEVTALRNSGRTIEELAQMAKASRETVASVPTSTYTENLRVINETTSAFGSLHHAVENLPFMQKSASVLQAAMPAGSQVDAAEVGNKMARVFEERGTAGNPEVFRREASEAMRAMVFSGGKFNPDEFLNFAQQAKSSLQNYNERFLTRIAPSLIGTQGGERAGTAANAFTSIIMGKANDAKQAEEWAKYGLLDTSQTIMKKGKITSWRAGAVKETSLALTDPLEWAEKVALPAMMAKGVKVDDRLELAKVLGTMFRNQNSNVFANEVMQAQQRSRLHKDEGMINQAGTLDEIYGRNLKDDPTVAIKALTASLENLVTTVSAPAMTTVAAGLTSLAGGIQAVSNVLQDHPLLAMSAGGAAAAGALGGSGYMAYKLTTGFGLTGSAEALDVSAAALTAAAEKLGAASALQTGEHAAEIGGVGGADKEAEAAEATKKGKPSMFVPIGQVLAYEWGKQLIEDGVDALPHPAYPKGYDPKAKLHEGPIDLARDFWRDSEGARTWLRNAILPSAHAEEAPRRPTASRPMAGQFAPVGGLGQPPVFAAKDLAKDPKPQKVDVSIEPPPPLKVDVAVAASSQLLSIVDGLKTLTAQLKARADTGPGGLGETHTGQ